MGVKRRRKSLMEGKGSGDPAYFVTEALKVTGRVGKVAEDDGDDDQTDRKRYGDREI